MREKNGESRVKFAEHISNGHLAILNSAIEFSMMRLIHDAQN